MNISNVINGQSLATSNTDKKAKALIGVTYLHIFCIIMFVCTAIVIQYVFGLLPYLCTSYLLNRYNAKHISKWSMSTTVLVLMHKCACGLCCDSRVVKWFFDLTSFYRLGQKYKNIFVRFLVQMKTLKFGFEIYWPLGIQTA